MPHLKIASVGPYSMSDVITELQHVTPHASSSSISAGIDLTWLAWDIGPYDPDSKHGLNSHTNGWHLRYSAKELGQLWAPWHGGFFVGGQFGPERAELRALRLSITRRAISETGDKQIRRSFIYRDKLQDDMTHSETNYEQLRAEWEERCNKYFALHDMKMQKMRKL